LALPADPGALELTCEYCGGNQLLPRRVIKQRDRQRQRHQQRGPDSSTSVIEYDVEPAESISLGAAAFMFLLFAGAMVGLILGIVHLVESHQEAEREAKSQLAEGSEAATTEPTELTPLPEETEDNNGLALVRARMLELHESGCDRVLNAPTRFDSTASFSMTLSKGSRHCVVVVAGTGMPETSIHLEAKDPLAVPLETPDWAASFEWRFCATIDGDHAFNIGRKGRGPFHMGVYDCPQIP
jgi:hypothetical protein